MIDDSGFYLAVLAGLMVNSVALVGMVFKWIPQRTIVLILPFLLSWAVGILLGNAFFHLIPEAVLEIHHIQPVMIAVAIGVVLFLIMEKIAYAFQGISSVSTSPEIKSIGYLNLIGDGIHNFIDGLVIGGSFLISPELGFTTTLAIMLHEIPQEIGDAGTLIYSGYPLKRVIKLNLLVGLSCLLGVVFIFGFQGVFSSAHVYLPALTAGGFIYMALGNLLPSLMTATKGNPRKMVIQMCMVFAGLVMIFFLQNDVHHHGNQEKATPMGQVKIN